MTFDDDFIRIGEENIFIKQLGLSWPPPEQVDINGTPMVRVRMSSITDEQRAEKTYVCRGAEYKPLISDPQHSERG